MQNFKQVLGLNLLVERGMKKLILKTGFQMRKM